MKKASPSKVNFIRARYLLPMQDGRRIADGYVLYAGETILEAGPFTKAKARQLAAKYGRQLDVLAGPARENLDADPQTRKFYQHNAVLLPGFVKAHGHDHESPLIGLVKDEPLTVWLDGAVNLFTKFITEHYKQLTARYGCTPNYLTYAKARLDDIYYGITATMVHHCNYNKYHVEDIVAANEATGTKMIVAVGSQDRNYYEKILDKPASVAVRRLDEYYEKFKHLRKVRIIPGPDQDFSNGPELLKALKQWANDHGTLIHCHSSEEYNTTEWFKKEYGSTPVEYFDSIGFLDANTVLAHQVQTTPHDLEILARTKTKIVHNPLANTILGSGMPPIMEMIARGIEVAISTDGSGSADNQNILGAARLASQYQKALHKNPKNLPAADVLDRITRVPARMLGMNAGTLEPGKDADIVLLDLGRPNLIPTRLDTVVENLIWAADGSEVKYVIANGRMLLDNKRFTLPGIDSGDILDKMGDLARRFDAFRKKAGQLRGTGAHR